VKHSAAYRVSTNLRLLRQASGLTQAELAIRARTTNETVARIERFVRARKSANANPSLETLEALAGALEVDVVELLAPVRKR
jgi:transcriptional regulator with XRE-family HTH domain